MPVRICRSIAEPIRVLPSFSERWEQSDKGLIISWERGREMSTSERFAEATSRALAGELVELPWRRGSWYYLAMWQGLRGDDLNITPETELVITHRKGVIRFPFDGNPDSHAKRQHAKGRPLEW